METSKALGALNSRRNAVIFDPEVRVVLCEPIVKITPFQLFIQVMRG